MKINVALFDTDKSYTERLQKYFQINYLNQISLSVFSDGELFLEKLQKQYFLYALTADATPGFLDRIPEKISFALLLPDNSVEEINGVPVVGKYQSMDAIYRRIMGLCAKKVPETKMNFEEKGARTVLFTSVQGGCGVTTCAAAYAVNLANRGKRVFFLDLNNITVSGRIFGSDEKGTFSDVIFAIKSGEANFQLALKSLVHPDSSGVSFFAECTRSRDMLEMTDSEVTELVEALQHCGDFEYVVIDFSGKFGDRQRKLICESADSVVYVCEPTETGKFCFERFCELASFVEKREKSRILEKTALLYNMYDRTRESSPIPESPVMVMGAIPIMRGTNNRECVSVMSRLDVMDGN